MRDNYNRHVLICLWVIIGILLIEFAFNVFYKVAMMLDGVIAERMAGMN